MKDLVRLFARPALRRNPRSWLTVFRFDWLTLAMRDTTPAIDRVYFAIDVGELPAWERVR